MKFKEFLEHEGVITAHNPGAKKAQSDENAKANKELEEDLKKIGLEYEKIKGKFNGIEEDSFLVKNAKLSILKNLAKKYKQHSIVWDSKLFKVT